MHKKLIAGLFGVLLTSAAEAFDPFIVKDIRVEGIQRTEAGTVFSYLPVKVGDTFSEERAVEAIKALFDTGFFKDVRIEIEKDVLVVVLDERPAIAAVDFAGVKEFDKEQLRRGLRDVGLAESRIYDRALVDKAEQELKRQYLARGYYGAKITTTITPLERNRVGINFTVSEGSVARIAEINIVGAQAFKEKELRELFALSPSTWMSWYTKSDQYSRQKLAGDLETLRSHYLDRGYLDFAIESTQVSITPDRQKIYISVNISEGERYSVTTVRLAGELALPEDELVKLVQLRPGDIFSREKINQSTKAIADRLSNEGYAFANVNAAPEVDKDKRTVAFTLFVDPGRRVSVRRINVAGNTRTRDEVIRREMRQMEAAWYDGEKINRSRQRIDKLGYFNEVTVETPPVVGTTDQVDVNVSVKEKPTGSLMLGAGFSSSEKLVLSGSIEQQNLFGSGKHLGLTLNSGKINKTYAVSYTDPYHTVDGISRGFDIYKRNVDTTSLAIAQYGTSSAGGGVRYGLPVSEENFINLGLSVDRTRLKPTESTPQRYLDYIRNEGESFSSLLATAGWARDSLDSRIYPMKGSIARVSSEVAMPGGSLRYYRANFQWQQFFTLTRDVALMINGEFGYGNGYGGKSLPFFKNYYAGGVNSVRGYRAGSLGPIDALTTDRLGGNRRAVANAEVLFPMPGMGQDKSMRLGVFFDAGQVWGSGDKFAPRDLRYSAGVSFSWTSPVGPLKFSIGHPLNRKAEDKVERLQFQLGTVF